MQANTFGDARPKEHRYQQPASWSAEVLDLDTLVLATAGVYLSRIKGLPQ